MASQTSASASAQGFALSRSVGRRRSTLMDYESHLRVQPRVLLRRQTAAPDRAARCRVVHRQLPGRAARLRPCRPGRPHQDVRSSRSTRRGGHGVPAHRIPDRERHRDDRAPAGQRRRRSAPGGRGGALEGAAPPTPDRRCAPAQERGEVGVVRLVIPLGVREGVEPLRRVDPLTSEQFVLIDGRGVKSEDCSTSTGSMRSIAIEPRSGLSACRCPRPRAREASQATAARTRRVSTGLLFVLCSARWTRPPFQ